MSRPKRILVVDDEDYNRDLLDAMLISFGYQAVLARDGSEALAKLDSNIDLVLLDVMMPGIDGFEVARQIRRDQQNSHIPVIMVTALTSKEDRLAAVEAGANDFITKPIDRVELRVRMASLLRIKEAQDIIIRHQAQLEIMVEMRTRALRESEERFRAVFETAQDGIFIKDRDLVYTHVNPAMLRLMDLSPESIIGKVDEDLLESEAAGHLRDVDLRVTAGQSIEHEYTISHNRVPITINCVRVPMITQSGEVMGICGIARDVTERKVLESSGKTGPDEYLSSPMRATLEQVRLAARTDALVLFLGESGAGKDHLARYLHDHSRRAGGPFFSINCAALARELAESELFGHEPGAFTGSRGRKRGLLELAEGGTLLLNEIGDLSPHLQAKLLTFLDTQSFTRVGGEKSISVNARLVAATNRDLEKEVELGSFRKDLYFRLNVFAIMVPPLRERIEDLPLLVNDLLETVSEKLGLAEIPRIDPEAMEALCRYKWPGNVRELRNVIERALILCHGKRITVKELGVHQQVDTQIKSDDGAGYTIHLSAGQCVMDTLSEAKRWLVQEGLRRSAGNVKKGAAMLGISRDQMKYLMKSLGVRRD